MLGGAAMAGHRIAGARRMPDGGWRKRAAERRFGLASGLEELEETEAGCQMRD
jgi:hypothetical protein